MKKPLPPGTLVLVRANSENRKIGDAASTYAEQRSCPDACVFKDGGGCYAEEGPVGKFITAPLNLAASYIEATPEQIAEAEADAIDGMEAIPGRPLRLHTVGDCSTDTAARLVAEAARRYTERGGGPVWTYTHAWREVTRASWGAVHVLASCETHADIAYANERGYASAVVVEEFEQRACYEIRNTDSVVRVLPCPAQTTEGVSCSSCRLCMDSERLRREGLTIGFAIHGPPLIQRRARLALTEPDNPDRRLSSRVLIPRYIEQFKTEHGREPNNVEVGRGLGIHTSSVWEMRRSLAGQPARPPRRKRRRKHV